MKQKLRKRDIVTRFSTAVLFLLLVLQLFTKKVTIATNLNSHEFCLYLIALLLLNVPIREPLLLKPLRILHSKQPKVVERALTHNSLPYYNPGYKDSVYKGIERGMQVGL